LALLCNFKNKIPRQKESVGESEKNREKTTEITKKIENIHCIA